MAKIAKHELHHVVKFTLADREAMFQYYQDQGQSSTGVAEHFKCSINTVQKIRKQDNWVGRMQAIQKDIAQKADRKRAAEGLKNLDIAKEILAKELAAYREREIAMGNIADIVTLINLINKMEGIGESGEGNHGIVAALHQHFTNCTIQHGSPEFERQRSNMAAGLDRLTRISAVDIASLPHSGN